jgi:hypothetical protein
MEPNSPYLPPHADLTTAAPQVRRFSTGEKILLVLLLINAGMGSAIMALMAARFGMNSYVLIGLVLPTLGFAAAGLMFRAPSVALALGTVFYLVQIVGYTDGSQMWKLTSGLQFSTLHDVGTGKMEMNWLAGTLALAHIVAWANRRSRSRSLLG